MLKKTVVLVLIVCLLGTLLCACDGGKKISSDEAYQIVLDDLGDLASTLQNPHLHEDKDGYHFYFNLNGLPFTYVVSYSGKITSKGPSSSHTH